MNGFNVMGRVLASGTKQAAIRWFWWQAARGQTGYQRAGQVTLRAFGSAALVWFLGGTLWVLGALWYVAPAAWFVAVGAFAEVSVEDTEPLPSPTDAPLSEDKDAGQSVGFVTVDDLDNPSRAKVVWVRKEAS